MNIGVVFIVFSLCLLIYLAYKGFSVIAIAPVLALFAVTGAAVFSGNSTYIMAHYTQIFMVSLGNFVKAFFPIFLLGAILGKFLEVSGSADSIANFITKKLGSKNAILAVVLSCAILTYGGVSLFVVTFAMYPIGAKLFREAKINKKLLPGSIALGAFTFTMTALPGSPQIQNAIPMKYFGTDAYAAPILGIIASLIMFLGGLVYLKARAKKLSIIEPGYGEWKENLESNVEKENKNLPSFGAAILPVIITLVVNFVFSRIIFLNQNLSYLKTDFFGNVNKAAVIGTWSLILALLASILAIILLNYKRMKKVILSTLNTGVSGSFLAIFNTASEVGYGNIIKSMAAFSIVAATITSISSNPLVTTAISSSVLAGITGSATGGVSIALQTMGEQLIQTAQSQGISLQVLHRVAAIACGGMDTLPHNGAVITLLAITQMTHKDSYRDICVNTVIIPTLTVIVIIVLGTIGIC